MYKKFLSVLLIGLLVTIKFGLATGYAASPKTENLSQFLKSNKEVFIKYKYPSMKLASEDKGAGATTLPAGTPIVLRNTETINSANITTGSSIVFKVVNDVIVGNKLLVKAGSLADAQITYAKKKNYAGVAGEVIVSDFAVRAVDGTYIPLRATLSSKGEEKIALSAGLGILLCILFLLIQGDDAIIPAGSTKCVYTMMDVKVNTDNS